MDFFGALNITRITEDKSNCSMCSESESDGMPVGIPAVTQSDIPNDKHLTIYLNDYEKQSTRRITNATDK